MAGLAFHSGRESGHPSLYNSGPAGEGAAVPGRAVPLPSCERAIMEKAILHPCAVNEIPTPVLFNPWKHHAGALRARIADAAANAALDDLAAGLVVVGTELMDLYH